MTPPIILLRKRDLADLIMDPRVTAWRNAAE